MRPFVCPSEGKLLRSALGLIIPTGYEQLHLLARAWHRLPALPFVASEVCVRLGLGKEWEERSLSSLCWSVCGCEHSFLSYYLSGCRYWCLPLCLCSRGIKRERQRTSASYPPLASPSPCSLSLHPSFLPPGPPVSGWINPPGPSSHNPFDYPHFTVPSYELSAGKPDFVVLFFLLLYTLFSLHVILSLFLTHKLFLTHPPSLSLAFKFSPLAVPLREKLAKRDEGLESVRSLFSSPNSVHTEFLPLPLSKTLSEAV